jgi:phenylpropionate dioxygenase-like ring-hydroxylating dioxygenase large terminal subunit
MLQKFWYACEFSSQITNKPKRVSLLNQEFVMYRNSRGEVLAFKDQCPHRGAAISLGWVEGDSIRCPYHGWKFNSEGNCIEIPSNQPGVSIPQKACLNSYPIQEKYGFIWLFWGNMPEKNRPPLPSLPEIKNPKLRAFEQEFILDAPYRRALENNIDPAHSAFVHSKSLGSGMAQQPQIPEYEIITKNFGATACLYYKQHLPQGFFWKYMHKKESREIKTERSFYLPNFIYTNVDNSRLIFIVIQVPVNENKTISKYIIYRNFLTYSWADFLFKKQTQRIFLEDRRVIESQQPKEINYDLASESHAIADNLVITYRKLYQKFLDMY